MREVTIPNATQSPQQRLCIKKGSNDSHFKCSLPRAVTRLSTDHNVWRKRINGKLSTVFLRRRTRERAIVDQATAGTLSKATSGNFLETGRSA